MMNNLDNITHFPVSRAKPEDEMSRLGDLFTIPDSSSEPTGLDWQCSTCGALVPPQQIPGGLWVKRRACECKRRERETHEQELMREAWMANQLHRTFGGWLGDAWANTDLGTRTFAKFKRSRDPQAYKIATAFANAMSGNIVFYGEYGSGKTHLAAAVCNALRERRVTSLFTTAPQFFAVYNDRMSHGGDHHNLVKQVIGTPLLVLDDVDKSRWTDAREDMYFLILDERYKAKRPTVITTNRMAPILDDRGNVVKPGLANYIGDAARSRIMRGLQAVEMVGDDFRLEQS